MILILLLSMFSIGYTNQINSVSGNIEKFSLMNGNSFINNTIDGVDNNLYKISLIQYPGQISSGQFLYIEKYKKYFIQSKIATINYGTLSNENKNNFKASDNIIEISIITESSNNIIFGSSIGYAWSRISDYTSSQLIHNIGLRHSLWNNKIIIGFSIENMVHTINEYSNINSKYNHNYNFSIQLNPQYINSSLFINYIYSNTNTSEAIISWKSNINEHFSIFTGKSFYLTDASLDSQYLFYDNFSMGIGIIIPKYRFNIGMQYLGDTGVVIGSSLIILVK